MAAAAAAAAERLQQTMPEDVQDQLDLYKQLQQRLGSSLDACAALARQLPPTELPPTERAQYHLMQAKAVQAAYHLLLRAGGKDPFALPAVVSEAERIKQYAKKVSRQVSADELSRSRPAATLDIGAASRFIDAAIPDLTQEQRKRLREVNHKGAESGRQTRGAAKRGKAKDDGDAEGPYAAAASAQQFLAQLGGQL